MFTFEFRGRFHLGQIGQGLGDARHYLLTQFRMRDLSPPEHQGHLHLVSLFEEAPRMADLRLEVVLVDARAELDFLELDDVLLLARLAGHLGLLELELAEVHDADHRRTSQRSDLDQIQPGGVSGREGDLQLHDAELFTVCRDHSQRTDANLPIHPNALILFLNGPYSSNEGKQKTRTAPGDRVTTPADTMVPGNLQTVDATSTQRLPRPEGGRARKGLSLR